MAAEPITQVARRCSRCSQHKPADRENFSFIKAKNAWHPWCKPCCAEQRRADRAARPAHYAAISKASRTRNIDQVRQSARQRYWATREQRVDAERERLAASRERHSANRRAKRAGDPAYAERQRDLARGRRDAAKDVYRGYAKAAWAKASTQRRLRTYFTSAICHSLKGSTKGGRSWEAILGYSANDLKCHLERQFTKSMTWGNYGDWHVDHIIPVASFSFVGPDCPEFQACWALPNLRPLWARENIQKSDQRTLLI
jgi:hypothetical protein